MARTQQRAKLATGGKKPRKTTNNDNNINNNNTNQVPKSNTKSSKIIASKSLAKKPAPKKNDYKETKRNPYRIRRLRRIVPEKYVSIYDTEGTTKAFNQWNRDYWRLPNMIGARFQVKSTIFWHHNTLFIGLQEFPIKLRHKIESFVCWRFPYFNEKLTKGIYEICFRTFAEIEELVKEHGGVECPAAEVKKYRQHRKKHLE
jgi:hypothetical protein